MVDYNKFAKTFSNSRKNMKWEEINYFISFLEGREELNILDIGCGNGRLLGEIKKNNISYKKYLGIDLSIGLINEAKNIYNDSDFRELDMLNINTLHNKYNVIYLIASFHHLENIEKRQNVLDQIYDLLDDGGLVFITNWSLNSYLNKDKYKDSIIDGSKNNFGSLDYNIKIGGNTRYYHCFDLEELKYLFKKSGFSIVENKEFKNGKNFISILKKV